MKRLAERVALGARALSMSMLVTSPILSGTASGGADPAGAATADRVPSPHELAIKRFPQPVQVGSLIDRRVLAATESRVILGHVRSIVRLSDGSIDIVMHYGGFLGWGGRTIGVPVDSVALLGAELVMVDYTSQQLSVLPPFDAVGAVPVPADAQIKIGLTRPSH